MQKDAGFELKKGFVTALKGQITYKSFVVPVLDAYALSDDQVKPYITVSVPTRGENNTKTSFGQSSIVEVRVVTGFKSALPGTEDCDKITDQVLQRLTGEPGMLANVSLTGHNAYLARPTIRQLANQFPGEYIIQNIIQFNVDTTQT